MALKSLQRCRGIWKSLLVILNNGNILTFATAVGLTNSNKDFRFVQSQDIGIAFSFWLVLVGISQVGHFAADFALQMGNSWFDVFVVGYWQALDARFTGLHSNLEIDVVLPRSKRHLLLVAIVKLEGYLISASLHVLSQEYQIWCNWRRSHKKIEEGFIESEILELSLAIADGYRLAYADLALIESQNIIDQC